MSSLANGKDEVVNCDHDEEGKVTSTDSLQTSCKSSQSMTIADDRMPMSVKKIGEMNGMTLPKNCDKSMTDSSTPSPLTTTRHNDGNEKEEEISSIDEKDVDNSSSDEQIEYVGYESELQMGAIMALITKDLSEPYSIYTYRYFIHNWPNLCFLAMHKDQCVGAIVCKLDVHKNMVHRGYIAMLAVEKEFRRHKIGTKLVKKAIIAMMEDNCDEVVLETEITNKGALHLYEKLGFVRDKRLFRYYLNGVDALRLKLWLR